MSLFIPKKNTKKADGRAVKNGEMVETPRVGSNYAIKPIVKPNRTVSAASSDPPAAQTPSVVQNTAPQSAKQRLENMSLEPLDPKSENWDKKVDIKAVRNEIKTPTNFLPELKDVHRRPTYTLPKYTPPLDVTAIEELFDSLSIDTSEPDDKGDGAVDGLAVKLMEHQVAGVQFMVEREKSKVSGGFLCDDMGLGKTVQSIALILENKPAADAANITTLVVCPLAVMDQWAQEITDKAPGLSVITYQGPKRAGIAGDLHKYNVVVTTYDTVATEHSYQDKNPSTLISNEWFRIIADEAHEFRNPKTKMAQAMSTLKSGGKRWCLTGTPIHNNIDDLYSLFRYIKVSPYDDIEVWKEKIAGPINGKRGAGDRDVAVKLLKHLFNSLLLRREQKVIKLPKCTRSTSYVTLDKDERHLIYEVSSSVLKDDTTLPLTKLLRMRQICNDKHLLPVDVLDEYRPKNESSSAASKKDTSSSVTESGDADDLAAMLGDVTISNKKCSNNHSSKTRAVLKIIKSDPTRKTVIFSSFVMMLKRLEDALREEDIGCKMYEGSLTADARKSRLYDFRTNSSVSVLLCSLSCAAVGINITTASRVIMIDPWWNPMIVDQAVNRVHRIGQKSPVDVYSMIAAGTIEERILALQEKKRGIALHMLEQHEKLSKEELQFILYGKASPTSVSKSKG